MGRPSLVPSMRETSGNKVSGIGKVTERLLGAVGVGQCGDLLTHRARLCLLFSTTSFQHFMRIALGQGGTQVARDGERKSMSVERTFSEMSQPEQLSAKCLELSQALAEDLQEAGLMGRTVTLKIKTVNFTLKTRSHTLQYDTNTASNIYQAANQLLKHEIEHETPTLLKLRLMGVRMSKMCPEGSKQTLPSLFQKQQKHSQMPGPSQITIADDQTQLGDNTSSDFKSTNFQETDCCEEEENFSAPFDINEQAIRSDEDNSLKQSTNASRNQVSTSRVLSKEKGTLLSFLSKKEIDTTHQTESSKAKFDFSQTSDILVTQKTEPTNTQIDTYNSKPQTLHLDLLTCPICGMKNNWSLHDLNKHIDKCLSKQKLQSKKAEILVESSNKTPEREIYKSSPIKHSSEAPKSNNEFSGHCEPNSTKSIVKSSKSLSECDSTSTEAQLPSCLESTSTPEPQTTDIVSCPLCGQQKRNWNLDLFNSHVDMCLSRQTIKDILQSQEKTQGSSTITAASSTSSTTIASRKRPTSNPHMASNNLPKRPKNQASLRTFFCQSGDNKPFS